MLSVALGTKLGCLVPTYSGSALCFLKMVFKIVFVLN